MFESITIPREKVFIFFEGSFCIIMSFFFLSPTLCNKGILSVRVKMLVNFFLEIYPGFKSSHGTTESLPAKIIILARRPPIWRFQMAAILFRDKSRLSSRRRTPYRPLLTHWSPGRDFLGPHWASFVSQGLESFGQKSRSVESFGVGGVRASDPVEPTE